MQQSLVRHAAWLRQLPWAHVSVLLAAATVCVAARGAAAQESSPTATEALFAALIRDPAAACPLASRADQRALDRCRTALYGDSALRKSLAPVVLWGRPSPDGRRLRDSN